MAGKGPWKKRRSGRKAEPLSRRPPLRYIAGSKDDSCPSGSDFMTTPLLSGQAVRQKACQAKGSGVSVSRLPRGSSNLLTRLKNAGTRLTSLPAFALRAVFCAKSAY